MAKRLIVIGAGPAGYVAALQARAAGLDVCLIGTQDAGGTCLQRGCIPTKTLIASCDVLEKFRRAKQYGIELDGGVSVHWPSQQARIAGVVGTMVGGIRGLLDQRGVEQLPGLARFVDARTVEVDGARRVDGDAILICTGSVPAVPALFPVDGQQVATSDDVLKWETLPESLVIIGGGVIACEFAFIFNSLGVDVSVIEATDRPLPLEDAAISTIIGREMRKRRIRFIPSAMVGKMEVDEKAVRCYQDGRLLASAERALVAIGRRPNSTGLDAQAVGVAFGERGEIRVNGYMQTNIPTIYAAGDITAQLMLAHAASAQAHVAVAHILGERPAPLVIENIPRVTFTHPEVASAGLTEEAARERGLNVSCGSFDFRALGKAHASGEIAGLVKVVADADSRVLLGVHMVGSHCAEMIHEAAIVLGRGGTVDEICHTVHAHPTLSEAIHEAAESVFGFATHKPLVRQPVQDLHNESIRRLSV
jgi:dihydrolipoamide dehydrogenase